MDKQDEQYSTLENDKLRVLISEHGAEMTSVLGKRTGKEYLWQADPKIWGRHAPILFPFVGKVNNNEYRYAGKTWKMGQHGFARDMDFTLLRSDAGSCTYELQDSAQSRDIYPFAFQLRISYALKKNTLQVTWEVENPAEEDLYFSIGGHPAFNAASGYYVTFGEKKELTYFLLDPESGCVDTEHGHTLSTGTGLLKDGLLKMNPELFEHDALIFDNGQIEQATLCKPDKTPLVTIDCAGFPSFGLWCQKTDGVPFVCLEPWMGRADNKDFHGELPEKYEEQKLAPHGKITVQYELTFH